jgi:hypothetical protein
MENDDQILNKEIKDLISKVRPYEKYISSYSGIDIFSKKRYDVLNGELLKLSQIDIQNILESWNETEKINSEIRDERFSLYREAFKIIEDLLKLIGLKVYRKSFHGKILGKTKEVKYLIEKLDSIFLSLPPSKPFPHEILFEGDVLRNPFSPCTILDVYEKGLKAKNKKQASETLYRKSLEYLIKLDIIIPDYWTKENIIAEAKDRYVQNHIKENFPEGEQVRIKFCEDCSHWEVGEKRCSCGNRRVELVSDGNLLDGIYVYPAPY